MANRRIDKLTQEDYLNAVDVYREHRTIKSVASALSVSDLVAKKLIDKGYPKKAWHALKIVIDEERVIQSMRKDTSEREQARRRYKDMTDFYEKSNMNSMFDPDTQRVDLKRKPLLKVKELRDLWELKADLLEDEIDEKGYLSPFQTWSDKELVDFMSGKRRPK